MLYSTRIYREFRDTFRCDASTGDVLVQNGYLFLHDRPDFASDDLTAARRDAGWHAARRNVAMQREVGLKEVELLTPGEVGDLFRSFFGEFHFDGIELALPTRTFEGRLDLDVGGRSVELIEVGPAHTAGDVIVHVPDASTVFTGDILFIGGQPIVWAGPLSNWIAACDLMLSMNVETVVPGHGPITDRSGIVAVRDYLSLVEHEASERFAAGIDAFDAARDISQLLGSNERFGSLGEAGRIAVNVDAVYRTLDPTHESPNVIEQFRRMSELDHLG